MKKSFFLLVIFFAWNVFLLKAEDTTSIKVSKMEYADFIAKYSVNDTSMAVINIFFDKRNNSAIGQLSFFPITAAIFPLSPYISVGLSLISFPMFVNGSVLLVKYRKKKLQKVLIEYKDTRQMPKWIRKKVDKSLKGGQYDYE